MADRKAVTVLSVTVGNPAKAATVDRPVHLAGLGHELPQGSGRQQWGRVTTAGGCGSVLRMVLGDENMSPRCTCPVAFSKVQKQAKWGDPRFEQGDMVGPGWNLGPGAWVPRMLSARRPGGRRVAV